MKARITIKVEFSRGEYYEVSREIEEPDEEAGTKSGAMVTAAREAIDAIQPGGEWDFDSER